MATWKEKGVVPDSDEDEDLDSQISTNEGHGGEVQDLQQREGTQHDIYGNSVHHENWDLQGKSSQIASQTNGGIGLSFPQVEKIHPSSESPRVFKIPPTLSDIEHGSGPERMDLEGGVNMSEDISKTYVTLSSQSSTLSTLTSLMDDEFEKDGVQEMHDSPIRHSSKDLRDARNVEIQGTKFEFPSTDRRSLRQRNPIQLHPYALEGEKYRRTLMARGMRPIRLTQVQQETRRDGGGNYSPDPETEPENESQTLSFEDQPQLSQTSSELSTATDDGNTQLISDNNSFARASVEEDEDLPDIEELFSRQAVGLGRRGTKRQRVTYSARYGSHLTATSISRSIQPRSLLNTVAGIGDTLASPPATSSPTPPQGLIDSNAKRSRLSEMPSSRAVSLEFTDIDEIGPIGNLPTPVTENVNHTIDLTADDIPEEDRSTSDSDSCSSSIEAETSLRFRRAGKRIRGVLPASWLRLDRQTKQVEQSRVAPRETHSLSPMKVQVRRGIAVPKSITAEGSPSINSKTAAGNHFLLDDSDDDNDEDQEMPGFIQDSMPDIEQQVFSSQARAGYAIDDNRVDIMAPSRKRQTKLLPGVKKRKRPQVSTSLFHHKQNGREYQPKIIGHLSRPQKTSSSNQPRHQQAHVNVFNKRKVQSKTSRTHFNNETMPPKLSILDVVELSPNNGERLPQFIRIAARNARSRNNHGRHSPTRKFIRLANRDDTLEAQSTLRDWREGTIQPREDASSLRPIPQLPTPLGEITEQMLNSDLPRPDSYHFDTDQVSTKPRKLIILKPRQPKDNGAADLDSAKVSDTTAKPQPRFPSRRQVLRPPVSHLRPAQLETTLAEHSHYNPNHAFGFTKKSLDKLYKKTHRGSALSGDIQLARFLSNDPLLKSLDVTPSPKKSSIGKDVSTQHTAPRRQTRRTKRTPRRLDASAAVFRQPSEPLVLDLLRQEPENKDMAKENGKLIGLGSYGTAYTYHFDIFPMPLGVFFHESTFIGSGKLCSALDFLSNRRFDMNRGCTFHQVAGKVLRWGPWNDVVSSELGLCFDWIAEQLELHISKESEPGLTLIPVSLTFVIDFVQSYLFFPNLSDRQECLLRFLEVLDTLTDRLALLTASCVLEDSHRVKPLIELCTKEMILIFQLLQISRLDNNELNLTHRFEASLQTASSVTIKLLLRIGLTSLRCLYDDLQYLAMREAGIKSDRYIAEAWVIALHVLQEAHIPRATFWDIFNSELIKDWDSQLHDARVLERLWYSIFSLLPLIEIDKAGVVVTGARMSKSFENWTLPQRMIKKVFELYGTKSRQSPSFNDYCRALFSRCSHLIQSWGWRRHASIIGTLFDFFATQKLAHLRNEEVYQSPRFLEELSSDPDLSIEPEDRCFHILLKLIAISIKQMLSVGDEKGIRNLVTRVLPNHDRQYPKEKTVRQRDLASLRNHHDLLCTLFWAAPPTLRPPLTLIRELVNPERSHKEAYLISLRAWENLTRFVLASDPTTETYLPFGIWQHESFTHLLAQHQSAEEDIEEQLSKLSHSAKQLIPQETIRRTIRDNRNQINMALISHLGALENIFRGHRSLPANRMLFFQLEMTDSILGALYLYRRGQAEDVPVIDKALDILRLYIYQVKEGAIELIACQSSQEEDSQGFDASSIAKMEFRGWYFGELDGSLLAAVREVLRFCLRSVSPGNHSFVNKVVDTWGVMASITVLCESHSFADYVSESGLLAELKMDDPSPRIRSYACQFLVTLLSITDGLIDFRTCQRDLLSDWLCFLVMPAELVDPKSLEFLRRRVLKWEPMLTCVRDIMRFRPSHAHVQSYECYTTAIKALFNHMYETLHRRPDNTSDKGSTKTRYQTILRRIMLTMKRDLLDMEPNVFWAKGHWKFAEEVIDNITTFFGDICPIDDFFKASPASPAKDSSRMVVSTFRQYGLRLDTDRGRNELNHYCFSIFKKAAVEGDLGKLLGQLCKSMVVGDGPWRGLTKHILTVFTPSIAYTAFLTDFGWLPTQLFLQVAEHQLFEVAQLDSALAVEATRAITRPIIKGLEILFAKCSPDEEELKHETVYLLVIVTRFITSVMDWFPLLMGQVGDEDDHTILNDLRDDLEHFYDFAVGARLYLNDPIRTWILQTPCAPDPNYSPPNWAALKKLITVYEALDSMAIDFHRKSELALTNLVNEIIKSTAIRLRHLSTLSDLRKRKYICGFLMFHGMRERPVARIHPRERVDDDAGYRPRTMPLTDGPDFGAIILQDIRNHWSQHPNGIDIDIKFGPVKKTAQDIEGMLKDSAALYKELERELGRYVWRYQKFTTPQTALRRAFDSLSLA